MTTDQKKSETILVPPFSPEQAVLVGPFSIEEITTYEIAPLKITINKTERSSHAILGGEPAETPSAGTPASALNPIAVLMDYLAKHPEDLQEIIAKLQNLPSNN